MPEFPLAIDRYADWLHVQVFEKKRALADDVVDHHPGAAGGTPRGTAASGGDQVSTAPARAAISTRNSRTRRRLSRVDERGLRFEVNLGRYLDTGPVSRSSRHPPDDPRGARMAAAFSTCSPTPAASPCTPPPAVRERTVTVDMSKTYQDWSRRNLVHNQLNDNERHSFVQSDVLAFIERMQAERALFDLIVLDPPSFSNSKRMQRQLRRAARPDRAVAKDPGAAGPGRQSVFFQQSPGIQTRPRG